MFFFCFILTILFINIQNLYFYKMNKISIFASGNGSNAENIIVYFSKSKIVKVALILTNNSKALVINKANKYNIPILILKKDEFNNQDIILEILKNFQISFIVLAGFLLKVPTFLISKFKDSIINIHPSLLPKHGGEGMYGDKVHESVLKNRELISGITVHFVDEFYDHGEIISQKTFKIEDNDTIETVKNKVKRLEKKYFPIIIESILVKL